MIHLISILCTEQKINRFSYKLYLDNCDFTYLKYLFTKSVEKKFGVLHYILLTTLFAPNASSDETRAFSFPFKAE